MTPCTTLAAPTPHTEQDRYLLDSYFLTLPQEQERYLFTTPLNIYVLLQNIENIHVCTVVQGVTLDFYAVKQVSPIFHSAGPFLPDMSR